MSKRDRFFDKLRAASAEEAVSSLPLEVHAARGPHEPHMSPVPENRENRLMRPGSGRPPISMAPDSGPHQGSGAVARKVRHLRTPG